MAPSYVIVVEDGKKMNTMTKYTNGCHDESEAKRCEVILKSVKCGRAIGAFGETLKTI